MPCYRLTVEAITRHDGGRDATYLDSTTTAPRLTATADGARFGNLSNDYEVPNDGKTFLHVKNGHASAPCKVTIQTPYTSGGNPIADREVNVTAAQDEAFIGPFPRGVYGDPFKFTLSAVANVTLAVLSI